MTEQKKDPRPTKGRVLLDCTIGNERYKVNSLITGSADLIEAAVDAGQVDAHPSAVARADKPSKAKG